MIYFQHKIKLIIILTLTSLISEESWKIYDDAEIAIIHISIETESLNWMYDNVQSDSLHIATVQFQNSYINEMVDSVGFRIRGNTSRNSEKKSFKIDFNHFVPGRQFYNIEKLNLNGEHNDPSIIRSKLCLDLFQEIGMVSSRASHAKLFINDEYYGLYISVEHIDDTFVSKNFDNGNGNLWKCLWPADLSYRGNNPEDYHPYYDEKRPYELKTNKDEYDFSMLARLIRIIEQSPDSLDLVLNTKEVLQYLAMNILTGSWDDYRFLKNNFYLYYDPSDDLIHWIPYDYDNTFSIDWFDIDWSSIDPYGYSVADNGGRSLTEYLFSQERYKNIFYHFLKFYNEKLFNLDTIEYRLNHFLDFLYQAADEDIYRTLDYGFTMDDFSNSYGEDFQVAHVKQGILEYIYQRKETLNDQIFLDNDIPIIYEAFLDNDIIILGDTVKVRASCLGNFSDAKVFYKHLDEENWINMSLIFQPDTTSTMIEDHDLWVADFIPTFSADYQWYITVANNELIDRFPIYGYKSFQVINDVGPQSVFINELLTNNVSISTDEEGEFDDWVELWNYSETIVDLSNYFLTDKYDNLTKWKFPDSGAKIFPNQFMIVWCDENQGQGNLHTNFKLSSDGEFLAIVLPNGVTILDSISFPSQEQDISFGRSANNQDEWVYLTPTPGFSNSLLSLFNKESIPMEFEVKKIYPNPFNSSLNVSLDALNSMNEVDLDIISLTGQKILSRAIPILSKGNITIPINIESNFASGFYFLKIKSNNHMITKKILYLK